MSIPVQMLHVVGPPEPCLDHWLAWYAQGSLVLLNHPEVDPHVVSGETLGTLAALGGERLPACLEIMRLYQGLGFRWAMRNPSMAIEVKVCQRCHGVKWVFPWSSHIIWCSPACDREALQQQQDARHFYEDDAHQQAREAQALTEAQWREEYRRRHGPQPLSRGFTGERSPV